MDSSSSGGGGAEGSSSSNGSSSGGRLESLLEVWFYTLDGGRILLENCKLSDTIYGDLMLKIKEKLPKDKPILANPDNLRWILSPGGLPCPQGSTIGCCFPTKQPKDDIAFRQYKPDTDTMILLRGIEPDIELSSSTNRTSAGLEITADETMKLDIYCLPSHTTLELGELSKHTKLDKLISLIEVGDRIVSKLVIGSEVVTDFNQTVGDLFKSLSIEASEESSYIFGYDKMRMYAVICENPVQFVQSKLSTYFAEHVELNKPKNPALSKPARSRRICRELSQLFLEKPSPDFAICPVDTTGTSLDSFDLVIKGPSEGHYKNEFFYFRVSIPVDYPFKQPIYYLKEHSKFPYLFDDQFSLSDFFLPKWQDFSPALFIRQLVEDIYRRISFCGRHHLLLRIPLQRSRTAPDRGPGSFQLRINHIWFTTEGRTTTTTTSTTTTTTFEIPAFGSDTMMDITSYIFHLPTPDIRDADSICFLTLGDDPQASRIEDHVTLNDLGCSAGGIVLNLVGPVVSPYNQLRRSQQYVRVDRSPHNGLFDR